MPDTTMIDVNKAMELRKQVQDIKDSIIRLSANQESMQEKANELFKSLEDLGYDFNTLGNEIPTMRENAIKLQENIERDMRHMQEVINSVKGA